MSDYSIRPGGSLKLKGAVVDGGITKKKKKKSKSSKSDSDRARERERIKELVEQDEAQLVVPSGSNAGSGRNSPATTSSRKTDAERRFEEIQRERLAQRVAKLANKTHKDRVNEFNTHLELLSEHHDIPKVGPG
ncbi:DUF1754-domain-containing protein [Hymenopellis radicata]|nr:DUF1754-domain-containing protein [Hymenopellis radicata]